VEHIDTARNTSPRYCINQPTDVARTYILTQMDWTHFVCQQCGIFSNRQLVIYAADSYLCTMHASEHIIMCPCKELWSCSNTILVVADHFDTRPWHPFSPVIMSFPLSRLSDSKGTLTEVLLLWLQACHTVYLLICTSYGPFRRHLKVTFILGFFLEITARCYYDFVC